jgi:hypothetical protein
MIRSWFARPRKSVQIDDLVKIKGVSHCLGKGVSGTVWKVVDKSVQEVMALKVEILCPSCCSQSLVMQNRGG